jgi:hypothetical protein
MMIFDPKTGKSVSFPLPLGLKPQDPSSRFTTTVPSSHGNGRRRLDTYKSWRGQMRRTFRALADMDTERLRIKQPAP